MDSNLAKELTNKTISDMVELKHFDNPFLDKFKFKSRMYNKLLSITPQYFINNIDKIIIGLCDDIINENLKTTVNSLIDKGLINENIDESGMITYSLNEDKF